MTSLFLSAVFGGVVKTLVEELIGDRLTTVVWLVRIFSHGVYTHHPFQANTFAFAHILKGIHW